jgi:hypothetical protein
VTVTIDENVVVVGGGGTTDVLNVNGSLGAGLVAATAFETINFTTVGQAAAVIAPVGAVTINSSINQTGTITLAAATTAANATAGNVTFVDSTNATARTFTNSGAGLMTVTLAADTATVDTIANTGTGRVTVNQADSTGITTVTLSANAAADTLSYANGTGGTTGVGSTVAANRVVVASGWNAATDLIVLDLDGTTAGTTTGLVAAAQSIAAVPTAAQTFTTTAAGGSDLLVLAFDVGGVASVLDGVLDGTALLNNFGGQTLSVSATGNTGYLLAYDNSDAFLYSLTEGVDADALVAATDIALIGVFRGVALGTIPAANITVGT